MNFKNIFQVTLSHCANLLPIQLNFVQPIFAYQAWTILLNHDEWKYVICSSWVISTLNVPTTSITTSVWCVTEGPTMKRLFCLHVFCEYSILWTFFPVECSPALFVPFHSSSIRFSPIRSDHTLVLFYYFLVPVLFALFALILSFLHFHWGTRTLQAPLFSWCLHSLLNMILSHCITIIMTRLFVWNLIPIHCTTLSSYLHTLFISFLLENEIKLNWIVWKVLQVHFFCWKMKLSWIELCERYCRYTYVQICVGHEMLLVTQGGIQIWSYEQMCCLV